MDFWLMDVHSTVVVNANNDDQRAEIENMLAYDADAYRLATLSGYSRKLHKPYDTYLKEQEMFQNNTDDEDDDIESSNEEDDLLSFLDSL